MADFRTGIGYDVHRLAEGESLWLGGIHIPHPKGTVGHSDGDVLIHAICDALFGAAGLPDIGTHFPDTSLDYKNIDSKILLNKTQKLIKEKNFAIGNIDSTLCLQKPKLKEYMDQMKNTLAEILEIDPGQLNIKATTTEKLGFIGREEGISAYAVCLLYKIK